MNKLLQVLKKYIILFILSSLFGNPWFYISLFLSANQDEAAIQLFNSFPNYVDFALKLVIIVLLIVDFKKEKLKHVVLTCIAAFFYPLLAVLILALLLLERKKLELKA